MQPMIRLMTLVLVSMVGVSACASNPPRIVWTKPNTTEADYKRDNYICVQESRTSWAGGGSGLAGALAMEGAKRRAQDESNRR
jgi:hypothetical protein